jgi:hypothetical protein
MPKIDPRADYRQVKGWANSHVLIGPSPLRSEIWP